MGYLIKVRGNLYKFQNCCEFSSFIIKHRRLLSSHPYTTFHKTNDTANKISKCRLYITIMKNDENGYWKILRGLRFKGIIRFFLESEIFQWNTLYVYYFIDSVFLSYSQAFHIISNRRILFIEPTETKQINNLILF